jgi:hypothetical protein
MMSDGASRSAMGVAAAQRCAAHFTISRTAPAWRDVLEAGAGARRRGTIAGP